MNAPTPINDWLPASMPTIHRWCNALLPVHAGVDDASQDVLMEVLAHPERIPAGHTERARWLYGVARNICARYRQAAIRHATHTLNGSEAAADDGRIEPDDLAAIVAGQKSLPEPLRPVADLVIFDQATPAEAAAELGLPETRVRVYAHRARKHLQLQLQAADYGWPLNHPWADSTMWCWKCGEATLGEGYIPGERLILRCPICDFPDMLEAGQSDTTRAVMAGVRSPRSAAMRIGTWTHQFFADAALNGHGTCVRCGGRSEPDSLDVHPTKSEYPALFNRCVECGAACDTDVVVFSVFHPQARRFWQRHRRITTSVAESRFRETPAWDVALQARSGAECVLTLRRSDYGVLAIRQS